ncbi:O-antigen polymerase [Candidatus Magnetoovum chiemensis]|nr:O-antigen polymerase [Candidatus Magnetoovum chiemensis]
MIVRILTILGFTSLLSFLTAISPALGLTAYFLLCSATLLYFLPIIGFYIVYIIAPMSNVNIIYDSPLRIVSERYSIIIIPLFLTIAALFVRRVVISNRNDLQFNKLISGLLFLIIAWTSISLFWTIDIYHGVNTIYKLSIGIIVYLLILGFVRDKETLERLFKIMVVTGFILSIGFFLSNKYDLAHLVNVEITKSLSFEFNLLVPENRPGGFAPPQTAANITAFFFFLALAYYHKCNRYLKPLMALLFLFYMSNIFATVSKGGIGSFFLGALFFIFFYPGLRKHIIKSFIVFFSSFIGVFIFNVLVLSSDRLVKSSNQAELSLTWRLYFWETGFKNLADTWVGAGTGGFATLVDPWPGAHSFYFSVLFDLGFIGVLLFFIFILYTIVKLRSSIISTDDKDMQLYLYCLLAAFVSFSIHGLVDMGYDLTYFWMLIGTIMAAVNVSVFVSEEKSSF